MANSDDTLSIDVIRNDDGSPRRWVEIAPLVFQEVGTQNLLAFKADARSQIITMFLSENPTMAFQKITWYQDPMNHLIGLGVTLLILLLTLVSWTLGGMMRLVRRKKKRLSPLEGWGRLLASGGILLFLITIILIIIVLVGDDSLLVLGYPVELTIAGILGVIAGIGGIVLLIYAFFAWRERAWSIVGRLHFTLVALAMLYGTWYLNQVNILGLHF